ncbi:MAG: hypothetical protein OXB98_01125 [Bryobacterales bacterium]|nr:hypothetical protein [Bryobacterales bacterium]
MVAWHLGKRNDQNTSRFLKKVRDAATGEYQISTDAFPSHQAAIGLWLEDRASYGRIVKVLGPGRVEAGLVQAHIWLETPTAWPAFLTTWRGEVRERAVRTRREPGGG